MQGLESRLGTTSMYMGTEITILSFPCQASNSRSPVHLHGYASIDAAESNPWCYNGLSRNWASFERELRASCSSRGPEQKPISLSHRFAPSLYGLKCFCGGRNGATIKSCVPASTWAGKSG